MSAQTIVWSFRRLPELGGQTHFVECDEELATRLIAADLAQDPRVGARHLREVEDDDDTPPIETKTTTPEVASRETAAVPAQTYGTRDLQAELPAKRGPGRPRKVWP